MSKYGEFQTDLNDQECLVAGLQEMGFEPLVFEVPTKLQGYQGDLRKETAEVHIPRKQVGGASNDIGFKKQDNGTFRAIISQFDRSHYNDQWLNELKQKTQVAKTKKIVTKQMGNRFLSETTATAKNGQTVQRLRFSINK